MVHRLAKHNEIWHDRGHLCVAGHLLFWWTLVHFFSNTNFRQRISCTLFVAAQRKLAGLGVWPVDTYFSNFMNFGLRVPRCHAVTCISPSLMRLYVSFVWFSGSWCLKASVKGAEVYGGWMRPVVLFSGWGCAWTRLPDKKDIQPIKPVWHSTLVLHRNKSRKKTMGNLLTQVHLERLLNWRCWWYVMIFCLSHTCMHILRNSVFQMIYLQFTKRHIMSLLVCSSCHFLVFCKFISYFVAVEFTIYVFWSHHVERVVICCILIFTICCP